MGVTGFPFSAGWRWGLLVLLGMIGGNTKAARPTYHADPEYLIATWESEDGLPENSATAMVQTPDGYLWFGTFNGLVRFDGVRCVVFDPSNTPGLPSGGIVNLHLDRSARLWVSTYKGIASLVGGKWTTYGKSDGWSGSFVRTFAERPDGALLMTTFDGIVLEFLNGRFRTLPSPPGERGAGYLGLVDESGHWCVVQHPWITQWDGQQWAEIVPVRETGLPGEVRAGPARDGGMWLFVGRELLKYNRGRVSARFTLSQFQGGFWSLFEDSDGNVWICTHDRGIYRVGPDGTMRHWDTSNGLSYNGTRFVFEDREKNLWVGTSGGGLQRFKARRFQSFGGESGLSERVVNSVCTDAKGNTWIATYGKGLFRLSGGRLENIPLPSREGALVYAQSVLADRSGRVWVGTYTQGLWVSKNDTFERIPDDDAGGGNVLAIFEDSGGRIWTSGGQAVAIHHGDSIRILDDAGLKRGSVIAIAEDAAGAIWLSNREGVFCFKVDRVTEVFDKQGQVIRGINCFKADADGSMWMGSTTQGLFRLTGDRLAAIDVRHGVPTVSIRGILTDEQGYFWMASNRGVVRVAGSELRGAAEGRLAKVRCQVFDVSDGLPGIECADGRQPVCDADSSGKFWFATSKGVAAINPGDVRINQMTPLAHIEEITYSGPAASEAGYVTALAGASQASVQGPFSEPLFFPAGAKRLSLRYAGLSFAAPERVRFQVKLEGEDADWQDMGDQRIAHYHDPRPGTYVFRVRASNNDEIWDEVGTRLAFSIDPFYWQTAWFRIGGGATLIAGGAGLAWVLSHKRHRRSRQTLERTHRQAAALVGLATSRAVVSGDREAAFREITEATATVMGVRRAGIWLLDGTPDELHCVDTFDTSQNDHENGVTLNLPKHLRYYRALESDRTIDASDALRDPRTSEFSQTYLIPRKITSLLDAPVRVAGKLVGVVCHEHVGARCEWTEDEIAFAGAVADLVSQVVLNAERKQVMLELFESEQRMSLAADAAHLGMWRWQIPTNRIWITDSFRELVGFSSGEEFTYEAFLKSVHPQDREATARAVDNAISAKAPYDMEHRLLLPDGRVRWIAARGKVEFDAHGKALSMQGVSIDITARVTAEREALQRRNELAHLSRVTMLSELSGSLAHELNQPLMAILSNAQAAQRFLAYDDVNLDELRDILKDIVDENKRAGEVIRRLRLLLKKGEVQQMPLDMNEVMLDVLKLVRSDLINHNVRVETELAPRVPQILGDRVQLQQVLLNLVMNACDAMAINDDRDRLVVIRSENQGGAWFRVSVVDCGRGIPRDDLDRVFEPFFTTKSHGMGLGLAVCRTIITAHGGTLTAENNPDRGAAFHMVLPVATETHERP